MPCADKRVRVAVKALIPNCRRQTRSRLKAVPHDVQWLGTWEVFIFDLKSHQACQNLSAGLRQVAACTVH